MSYGNLRPTLDTLSFAMPSPAHGKPKITCLVYSLNNWCALQLYHCYAQLAPYSKYSSLGQVSA